MALHASQVFALNAKSLTIGGAFTALIAGIIYQYSELVTPEFLLLAALILFFVFLSYGVSWGATQAYKVLYHNRTTWKQEKVRRKIYRCALYSGAGTMLLCGSFFLLADDLTNQEKAVVGVFWLLACLFIGFTSPLVWRWAFGKLLPRFNRYVAGKTDDNEAECEALNRPSEVPRD
jgi:hypothetical protein